jgi:biotin operon repressor
MTVKAGLKSSQQSAPPSQQQHDGLASVCRLLHACIDQLDEAAAATVSISRNELRCLNLLEFGPVPANTITKQLRLTSGSITTLIDRLEEKGLVVRVRHPTDRRVVLVEATPVVFGTVGRVYLGFSNELKKAASSYSSKEMASAIKHLQLVAMACQRSMAV